MSYPKLQVSLQALPGPSSQLRSLKLTPTQRKKLLSNHRQEEIKQMILYKYLEKKRLPVNIIKTTPLLQSMVTNFIRTQKLSEENLKNLCEQLSAKLSKPAPKEEKHNEKSIENNQIYEEIMDEKAKNQRTLEIKDEKNFEKGAATTEEDSEDETKSLYKGNEIENEWSLIVKYRQKQYEEDVKRKKEQEKQKKLAFKMELDRQLALKSEVNNANTQIDDKLELRIRDFRMKQEAKLSENISKRKKLLENEQRARDEQFKEINSRLKKEKKFEADLDKSLVIKAKEELFREQESQRKKKLEYQLTLKRIMEENEANKKKVLASEDYREKEAQLRALTEENEMLVRKETQKLNESVFRDSKLKHLQSLVSDRVQKEKLERIRLEEQNHLKYLREMEIKEKEKEEIHRKLKEEQKEILRKSLEAQIIEKQSVKHIEEELNKKQAEFWKKDIEDFHNEEEAKKFKARDQNLKTLEAIKKQMEEGQRKKDLLKSMNELELLQNKDILKDICMMDENKSVVQKTLIHNKKQY